MAALTEVTAPAPPGPGVVPPLPGPPDAGADRSAAAPVRRRSVRSWPLLVLAAPAAAEVWSGWVGIAQGTGFGLVSPLPGLAFAAPGHSITLPGRRGGVRGVRAAGLAGRRHASASGHAGSPSGPRSLLRARHGRAGRLPPAGPGRGDAGAVGRHHHRVLPAGPGPGHGDHARPHAARRRWHRSDGPERTGDQPIRSAAWSARTSHRPPRTRPHSSALDGTGPPAGTRTSPPHHDDAGAAAATPVRLPARPACPPAGLPQRESRYPGEPCARAQGLQPGPERPRANGQR